MSGGENVTSEASAEDCFENTCSHTINFYMSTDLFSNSLVNMHEWQKHEVLQHLPRKQNAVTSSLDRDQVWAGWERVGDSLLREEGRQIADLAKCEQHARIVRVDRMPLRLIALQPMLRDCSG